MLSLQIQVHQVMDLYSVSGGLWDVDDFGQRTQLATFREDYQVSDAWLSEDPTATLLHVVRQWSERTSRPSSLRA